jgi:hypothetical protein
MIKSLVVSLSLLALGGTAASADPQNARADANSEVISFDNWEIRQGLIDHSYLLIAESRGHTGRFWLSCDGNGLLNVAVPLIGKYGRDRLRSFPVTIWSDQRKREELNFLVFENFVAVAMDYHGGQNPKLEAFLNALQTAKQTFTISYENSVFEFDVGGLPAAQARFTQLCGPRQTQVSVR